MTVDKEDNKNSSDPEMTSGAKLMLDDFKKYEDEIKQLRKENEELKQILIECDEYFDNYVDADHDSENYIPNKEMVLLSRIRQQLKQKLPQRVIE